MEVKLADEFTEEEELEAYRILSSPWRFGEVFLVNRDGTPRRYWEHQKQDLDDKSRRIIHQDGTEVGKSIDIATDILHFLSTTEGKIGLCVAPITGQYESIIEEIKHQFDHSEVLRASLHPDKGQGIKKQPYHRIEFSAGSVVQDV